ncbi:flagellar biosynthesis anti-sigma factor FlgM [Thalassovita aquimarina]|uniref:Negative regulator of flagellin synthesis n=1 Tax=Thalassovita aquimarina TaxID=2785917 RepID=A0ABS5HL21_9RHOB|nr:flagellar biosynthesis anti-sigma factor FlgM [Thalassovita aquimarina]MBR9649670.1 flagellar biosynthesis anti-sigma factor FlgM [Thalassovita aquimarina]
MVDPIKISPNASATRSVSSGTPQTKAAPAAPQKAGSVAGAKTDAVSLSATASTLPGELKAGPPFDTEAVNRIKNQLAEGKYPVDVDKITDSLFQGYMELAG